MKTIVEDTKEAYEHFLTKHPSGWYARRAREGIKKLELKKSAGPKESPPSPTKSIHGSFTDPRDGQVYKTIELIGKTWMAENLNYDVGEGCWYYRMPDGFLKPAKGEMVKKHGLLYNLKAAKKACPPGWHLPTDD